MSARAKFDLIEEKVRLQSQSLTLESLRTAIRVDRRNYFKTLLSRLRAEIAVTGCNAVLENEAGERRPAGPGYMQTAHQLEMLMSVRNVMFCYLTACAEDCFVEGFVLAQSEAAELTQADAPAIYEMAVAGFRALNNDDDLRDRYSDFRQKVQNAICDLWVADEDGHARAAGGDQLVARFACRDMSTGPIEDSDDLDAPAIIYPNEPLNHVDFVEDLLLGLEDSHPEHAAIALRLGLGQMATWRANYYVLQMSPAPSVHELN